MWGGIEITSSEVGRASEGFAEDASTADSGDELEELIGRLRCSYSVALAFARDLPLLGRCLVDVEDGNGEVRRRHRWLARFPTRLYVETHIRSQVDHLIRCLGDQMLDPAKEATLGKIVSGLEDGSAKLTSWRRVRTLFLQLPPVAAALPVLVAALADPLSDVQRGSVAKAGLVMLVSVALVYLIVVWPSLKLGFRGKRAIFSGGEDLAHPLMFQPGKATWRGFPVNEGPVSVDIFYYCRLLLAFLFRRRDAAPDAVADQVSMAADSSGIVPAVAAEDLADQPRLENFPRAVVDRQRALRYAAKAVSDARLLEFPNGQVYRDEDEVFNHLGRRKLEEVPIDLFLSLGPYLALLVTGSSVVTYIAYLMRGGAGENPYLLALAPLMVLFSVLPAQMILQLRANLWLRRRRWEVPAAGRRSSND